MEKKQCDVCSKCFLTKGGLKEHVETVHEKKTNFTCEICGASYYRMKRIIPHMRKKHPGEEGKIQAIVRYGQNKVEKAQKSKISTD